MAEIDNPYRSPQDDEERAHGGRGAIRERPERDDSDPGGYRFMSRWFVYLAGSLWLAYMALLYEYPLLWAYGTGVLIAVGSGLVMTKLVFRFERPAMVWGLTPVFGAGWILLFWIVYRVMG
jgi:hypothetical protein